MLLEEEEGRGEDKLGLKVLTPLPDEGLLYVPLGLVGIVTLGIFIFTLGWLGRT